jgi:hypothetical protein
MACRQMTRYRLYLGRSMLSFLNQTVKNCTLHPGSSGGAMRLADHPTCLLEGAQDVFPFSFSTNNVKDKRKASSFSRKSSSTSTAGRSRVFFKKGSDLSSDVFRRQAMPVIGIENEAVGFLGGLEGVA